MRKATNHYKLVAACLSLREQGCAGSDMLHSIAWNGYKMTLYKNHSGLCSIITKHKALLLRSAPFTYPKQHPSLTFRCFVMAVASPPNTEFHFRTANLDDADDLAAIACAAFPSEPEWDYRFPHSKEFPSDTFHYHKEFYETLLKREINVIRVVTRAVENEEGEEKGKVIAFAIWEMQYKSSAFVGPLGT